MQREVENLKITFMGAGSTVFAKNVLGDCLCSSVLRECEIALYDIDAYRLRESSVVINALNNAKGNPAKIRTYLGVTNRKDALKLSSHRDFIPLKNSA
jgi:alpha-galactosidase